MKRFLARARAGSAHIICCIGNEAADADSIISALCYSFLRQQLIDISSEASNQPQLCVPVVSIPRADIVLRRDVEILLQFAEISLGDLICLDECPLEQWTTNPLKMVLLDHNKIHPPVLARLQLSEEDIVGLVEEIVDHHKDSGAHAVCQGPSRNIAFDSDSGLATVGSACTLVFEKFQALHPSGIDPATALLLLGVIALDTMHMDPAVGKGTPRDQAAIDALQALCPISSVELFNQLKNAKTDVSFWMGLSAADCFRLDYKSFPSEASAASVGISSVLLPAHAVLSKADLKDSVLAYLSSGVDVFMVMMFFEGPEPSRQLLTVTHSRAVQDHVRDTVLSNSDPAVAALGLSSLNDQCADAIQALLAGGLFVDVYRQTNVKHSRKQVAPIVVARL